MVGTLSHTRLLGRPWPRRALLILLLLICAALTLFPERYRAAVSLTPSDPSSLGLSGTLGQLGAVNSVFGNQAAVEIALKVARSTYVRRTVAARLKLSERLAKSPIETDRWLERKVEIRSLRGGIMQFEMKHADADFARTVVGAFAEAVREQLARVARNQTAYKRDILVTLVDQASDRLTRAQYAYDTFRLQTRYSQPQAAIEAIGERIPVLEATIKAKEVQLNSARQFATDENMSVRQIIAEIAALRQQLAQARATTPNEPNSVGRVVRESTQAEKLRRDLDLAQSLYDNYKRFLQGTSVEDLTSTANVRILEPPYVDTKRQLNLLPLALGLLIGLLGLAIEFYQLRPPVGDRALA
jgi:hypothetical protein